MASLSAIIVKIVSGVAVMSGIGVGSTRACIFNPSYGDYRTMQVLEGQLEQTRSNWQNAGIGTIPTWSSDFVILPTTQTITSVDFENFPAVGAGKEVFFAFTGTTAQSITWNRLAGGKTGLWASGVTPPATVGGPGLDIYGARYSYTYGNYLIRSVGKGWS